MPNLIVGRPDESVPDGWPPLLHISIRPAQFTSTEAVGEGGGHLAYGYVRAEVADEVEIALLRQDMAQFCRECGYRLTGVAVDRGSDGSELARAGFAAALANLELAGVSALVVPTLGHLSDDPVVRQGLLRQVARTGAEVLTVYREDLAVDHAELAAAQRRHPSGAVVWRAPDDLGGAAS